MVVVNAPDPCRLLAILQRADAERRITGRDLKKSGDKRVTGEHLAGLVRGVVGVGHGRIVHRQASPCKQKDF